MRRKRKVSIRSTEEWKEEVLTCLKVVHGIGNRSQWGCLDKNKVLFRINGFIKTRVPNKAIFLLKREGLIQLKNDGYYKYVPPKGRKKRRISV